MIKEDIIISIDYADDFTVRKFLNCYRIKFKNYNSMAPEDEVCLLITWNKQIEERLSQTMK